MLIPVLFTQVDSNYNLFDCFDTYDKNRNAFTYYNRLPLIAHPPCRKFSRLRTFSTAPVKEKQCAFFALSQVRQFGGILEHPRSSTLWQAGNFDLSGHIDNYGGFLRSVNLSWFGFPAEKKTMLYFVGISPDELPHFPLSFTAPLYSIGNSKHNRLQELPKKYRSSTPLPMIEYFIQVMNIINNKNL